MNKPKKKNKTLYIMGGILLTGIVLAVIAKTAGWIGGEKPTEVNFAQAKRTEIMEKVSASGKIQPVTEVKISPQVSGEIVDMFVEEGDSVVIGKLLARIKPDFLRSALDRVNANLNSQRATLEQIKARAEQSKATFLRAKADFERQTKLFEQKAISRAELDLATANYNAAKADLDAATKNIESARFSVSGAEASVKEASENLSFTNIYAPMGGTVSRLNVEKGERVVGTAQMAGTEMMRIADLNAMEVRVEVNENDIVRVSLGDTALIEVDSYTGQKFKGLVSAIANSAKETPTNTDAVTEFEVKIRILNSSYKNLVSEINRFPFRPGMTASVEIITDRKANVLTVPLSAITTRTGKENADDNNENPNKDNNTAETEKKATKEQIKEVVFVNENGVAKMVEVKTGISDSDNIEILSGISEGQQVIAGPFFAISKKLKDGKKITEQSKNKGKDTKD